MGQVLVFLLLGIGYGGLISGTGIGIVLSYRGSGVINLAAGSMAMLSGYCFWALRTGFFGVQFDTVEATALTIVCALVLAAVFEGIVIYPLRNATPLAKLVASLGFLIASMAAVTIGFGTEGRPQPAVLPLGRFELLGYPVLWNRIWIVGLILAAALALIVITRYTRFGLNTRATAERELHAVLAGLSPRWLSFANTALMSLTMTLVCLCAASIQVLDPTDLPLLVVPGLAAAVFASMSSISVAFIAGTVIGAFESLLVYLSTLTWFPNEGVGNPLPGASELLIFVFLVIAVVVRGGGLPARGELVPARLPRAFRPLHPLRSGLVASLVALVCLWQLPGVYRGALTTSLMWMVLGFSIVLITGFVGQVSAVQLALGSTAGFIAAEIAMHAGFGFPFGPILGVVGAAGVGFLLGIPALRVRGVTLVIVTLAGAVALSDFVFANNQIDASTRYLTAPAWFGFPVTPSSFAPFNGEFPSLGFCALVLAVALGAGLFVCNVRRSGLGREFLAVRSNERAAMSVGINVRNTKLLAFTLAAGVAGLAGVFLCYAYGPISLGGEDVITTLELIAFVYIFGITSVPGAVIAGLFLTGNFFTVCLQQWFHLQPNWTSLGAGLLLVIVLVGLPDGIAGSLFYGDALSELRRRLLPPRVAAPSVAELDA